MNKLFTFLATIILTTQFTLHSQTQIGQEIEVEMEELVMMVQL